ncbi:Nuclear transport factor 2 family protein [Tenacibaculum sp. 190130A14a]|uniref:Nuclear transport factor 2 family protein n=1 Tax=Tenacibaculum polynesiense TaxID=3137857 RepID=A0ABM9P8H7_9FLAO
MYQENIKEIETLINTYFEGIFYGNVSNLLTCFSNDATLYGDINSIEYIKNLNEYIETVKTRKSPNDLGETLNMSIMGIDILGKAAMVKLHVPMLGFNYYDYLSLFKIQGKWKIVNKLFAHVV